MSSETGHTSAMNYSERNTADLTSEWNSFRRFPSKYKFIEEIIMSYIYCNSQFGNKGTAKFILYVQRFIRKYVGLRIVQVVPQIQNLSRVFLKFHCNFINEI